MTYNIVCADSPIFESVYYDDIEGMLQLFQQGRASPFDMDEFGTTLLDVSFEGTGSYTMLIVTRRCPQHYAEFP